MRINSRGQITLPADLRKRFGLSPGAEVELVAMEDGILLKRVQKPRGIGEAIVEHMRGRATRKITTDEIMALTRGE